MEECELGSESRLSLCSPDRFKFCIVAQVRRLASPEHGGESLREGIKKSSPESSDSSSKSPSRLPMKKEAGSDINKCCCIMRLMDIASLAKHSKSFVLLFL